MFGVFNRRSNKSSKRVNRKRRTSKRRTNRRRRQRGGNADYASAYGSGASSDGDAEAFMGAREGFEASKMEEMAPPAPKGEEKKEEFTSGPAPVQGGGGMPNMPGGGRRRRRGGRKSFGTGEMSAAALALANFYGPGSKSRRNRRKSRKNRSQRRRR
tara:strand:- start:1528 stop:1998 length:471 start_codon:yes stop_codon:yes gene_type:complete